MVGAGLFRPDSADKTAVGDVFVPILRDVSFMDEVYDVCAFDPITDTLGKVTKFISGGLAPCDFVFWVS